MGRHSKRRVPKLAFTKTRGIGWHVNYRDPQNGMPRKLRFGMVDRSKAAELYGDWLGKHLKGAPHQNKREMAATPKPEEVAVASERVVPGSLLHVASNYLFFEEKRTRKAGEPRRSGTISPDVLAAKRYDVKDFMRFINRRHGAGTAGTLAVIDLKMQDVEAYNGEVVKSGASVPRGSPRRERG
jgi:hypothetical protein